MLTLVVMFIIVSNYIKSFRDFWSPITFIAIIFTYYCLLGPYHAITTGQTHDRLLNMRPFYFSALLGALVFLLSFIGGFHLNRSAYRFVPLNVHVEDLYRYGLRVTLAGFILFTISTGGNVLNLVNPLDASEVTQSGGSLGNYLGLSLNFMIPGVVLIFMYVLRTRKGLVPFILFFLLAVGIFTSLGFRYRLVLLVGSLIVVYYLNNRSRPNIIASFVTFFSFILVMGVINESRQYGKGLDTTKLEEGQSSSYFESGLNESRIFQTSGAVIDLVPEQHPHVGFAPIVSTLLFPIPSTLFPGKNSGQYLFETLNAIYGKRLSKGSAFLAYAEYYLAFGWLGIIGGGMFLGWFGRKLWQYLLSDPSNSLNIVVYATTLVYLYVVLSRGYMPQVTMLFFFSVFPVFVVRWLIRRKTGYKRPQRIVRHASNLPHPQ